MIRKIASFFRRDIKMNNLKEYLEAVRSKRRIIILSTRACMYIAQLLSYMLRTLGIKTKIIRKEPIVGFGDEPYIVIAAQTYKRLPLNYIAVQAEQLESSKWFTDSYYQRLDEAVAIFDYSKKNIEYLYKYFKKKPIYFSPITINPEYKKYTLNTQNTEKQYDIVFYGSMDSDRRQHIIGLLAKKYKLKIINRLFGEELYKELAKGKIVINIHYYHNALLETTRIFELLSLNYNIIISEKGIDQEEHTRLEELVDFIDIGDIDEMVRKIDYYLLSDDIIHKKLENNRKIISELKENETLKLFRGMMV